MFVYNPTEMREQMKFGENCMKLANCVAGPFFRNVWKLNATRLFDFELRGVDQAEKPDPSIVERMNYPCCTFFRDK